MRFQHHNKGMCAHLVFYTCGSMKTSNFINGLAQELNTNTNTNTNTNLILYLILLARSYLRGVDCFHVYYTFAHLKRRLLHVL